MTLPLASPALSSRPTFSHLLHRPGVRHPWRLPAPLRAGDTRRESLALTPPPASSPPGPQRQHSRQHSRQH
eukprot:99022-Pleurochrysis_carterae.AAC.2